MADTVAADRRTHTPARHGRRRPDIQAATAEQTRPTGPVAVGPTTTGPADADPLRAVAAVLRHTLGVPYLALDIHCGPTVEAGHRPQPGRPVERFPLWYRGRELATLRTVPKGRRTGQLLAGLADEFATLVHAALTDHGTAAARESERRALRRDLHDGLGSALAGLRFQVKAARRNPDLLTTVERDLTACGTVLRGILDGLRPPDLTGGLVHAVTATAARMSHPGLSIDVVAPAPLPTLTSAVELTAYQITCESLTNTARHSRATTCTVRLTTAGAALTLEIADDGSGPPAQGTTGLGLGFMRERATEVGGTLTVLPAAPHGTVVRAVLPMAAG